MWMTSKILFGIELNKEFRYPWVMVFQAACMALGKLPYVVVLLTITIQLSEKPIPKIF
jgi:hypothetical protein